ncbi:MAG: PAS domain S-box protein [Methanomicrobiaceae archaeon]|nr:PAS domain S-box protein [Methanomicrobiaceae archaeon]
MLRNGIPELLHWNGNDDTSSPRSDPYFDAVFERAGVPMLVTDAQGSILEVNQEWIREFGFSPESLLLWDLFPRIDAGSSHKWHGAGSIAVQFTDLFGLPHDIILKISPIPGTSRHLILFSEMCTVQEQVKLRTRDALREGEERYRMIFESAKIGILVAQDGFIRYANPWTVTYLGTNPTRILSVPFTTFIHPEDRERVLSYHERRLSGESVPETYTLRVICNGETRWLALSVVRSIWEGRPATLTFLVDIDEQVRVKQALDESEARYRTIIDAMSTPVHVIDRDLRILLVNSAFREWAERLCPGQDILGTSLTEAIPLLGSSAIHSYREVFASGIIAVSEESVIIDGEEYFTEIRKIPVFQDDGSVAMVVTVIRDITSDHRMEVLKQEALVQVEKNMEQFAILNDHIRNPLQAIVGLADLEGGDLAEKIIGLAGEIDTIIKRLDIGWLESKKISEFLRKH